MNMIHELYELRLFTQKKDTKKRTSWVLPVGSFFKNRSVLL